MYLFACNDSALIVCDAISCKHQSFERRSDYRGILVASLTMLKQMEAQ